MRSVKSALKFLVDRGMISESAVMNDIRRKKYEIGGSENGSS